MQRHQEPTSIGRYTIEVLSGKLFLYVPESLITEADEEHRRGQTNVMEIEMERQETLDLLRTLRGICFLELESQPAFPLRSAVSLDEITRQLQARLRLCTGHAACL